MRLPESRAAVPFDSMRLHERVGPDVSVVLLRHNSGNQAAQFRITTARECHRIRRSPASTYNDPDPESSHVSRNCKHGLVVANSGYRVGLRKARPQLTLFVDQILVAQSVDRPDRAVRVL